MSQLDQPVFSTAAAAQATGASKRLLKSWMERAVIAFRGSDHASDGTGFPRLLTLRRVYQTGLSIALSRLGMTPTAAARAALAFSDQGNSDRLPGCLYTNGRTWLVCLSGGRANVVNALPGSSLDEIIGDTSTGNRPNCAAVVDCGKLIEQINATLAVKPWG